MRGRIQLFVVVIALVCCGVGLSSVPRTSAQDEPDYGATIAALEDRIDGLEARVELLEQHQDASTAPGTSPTATPAPITHTVDGTISLFIQVGVPYYKDDDVCNHSPKLGLTVDETTVVSIQDQTGTVVGIGRPEDGKVENEDAGSSGYVYQYCNIPFVIKDVPTSDFYTFTIQGIDGEASYSYQELEDMKWKVNIALH